VSSAAIRVLVPFGQALTAAFVAALKQHKVAVEFTELYLCDNNNLRGNIIRIKGKLYVVESLTDRVSRQEAEEHGARTVASTREVKPREIDPCSVTVTVGRGTQPQQCITAWEKVAREALVKCTITEAQGNILASVEVERPGRGGRPRKMFKLILKGTTVSLTA